MWAPDLAQDDWEAVELLNLTIACKRFKALPGPGGILDQDSVLMRGMMAAIGVLDAKQAEEMERKSSSIPRPQMPHVKGM